MTISKEQDAPSVAAYDPLCVRVPEACRLISIGRSKLYELIASGEIESIKIGTSTRIVTASLRRLVAGTR